MGARRHGKPISVFVADAEAIFGDALAGALRHFDGLAVRGPQPTSGLAAVEEVSSERPDVALLDYWLRGMEGPAATVVIAARSPATKVVLLSWFFGPREVNFAMAAGAAGFLPKSLGLEEVVASIRRAAAGDVPVVPEELAPVLAAEPKAEDRNALAVWERIRSLTPRELEVLIMLGREIPIPQIGEEINISPATVRRHVHNILKKTETGSQFEAVGFARHYGIFNQ